MTNQEAFDKVWNHFVVDQKPFSINTDTDATTAACRYRHDLTAECETRCAVGLFLPNEAYRPELDNGELLPCDVIALCPDLFDVTPRLMFLMQHSHDITRWSPQKEKLQRFITEMERVATDFKLKVPKNENTV